MKIISVFLFECRDVKNPGMIPIQNIRNMVVIDLCNVLAILHTD